MWTHSMIATLTVALSFAAANAQDQCRIGCPCGEACIDCDDDCHLDDLTGEDPANNNGVVIAVLVVSAVVVVFGLAVAAAAYLTSLPGDSTDHGPTRDPLPPNPTGLNAAGQIIMTDCVERLCGDDAACRVRMYEGVSAAHNKRDWLRDAGCLTDEAAPETPTEGAPSAEYPW